MSRASPQLAQSPPRLLTAKRRGSTRRGEKCGACASMNSITTKTTSCWTTKSYSVTTRGSAQPGHRPRLPPQAVEEALLGGQLGAQRGGRDGPSGCCSASATVMRGATGRPALWSARRARPPCCAATRATSRSGSNGAGLGDALRAGRDVRAGEHAPAARRWRPAAARRSPAAPPSGPGTTAPTADNPPPAARGPPATPRPRPSAGPCTRDNIRATCMRTALQLVAAGAATGPHEAEPEVPAAREALELPFTTTAAAPPAPRSARETPRGGDAPAPPRRTRGSDAARLVTRTAREADRRHQEVDHQPSRNLRIRRGGRCSQAGSQSARRPSARRKWRLQRPSPGLVLISLPGCSGISCSSSRIT